MKILIGGATGMIGSALTEKCLQAGHSVHYLTTSKDKIDQTSQKKGFYWNPDKGEIDTACFEDVEAIVNLAGANIANRWTSSYKKQILNSRIDTANVLFAAIQELKNHTIQHYVSASGTAIYPSSYHENYHENESLEETGFLAHVVKQWELHANQFQSLDIPVTIIRTGLVLSDKGGVLQKMVTPVKYGVGAALGSGKQWQSWIHIDDIARMYKHVLEHKHTGIYNATAPNPKTNKELTKAIAEVLQKPFFMPNVPKFILKLALGEMSQLLFSSQKVASEKIQNTGFEFNYEELKPALEDLLKK